MNCIFVIFCLLGVSAASDYSYPRILIVGPTGVGKSSLGNVLAGCKPNDEECFFPVCHGPHSCTKQATIVEAPFMGKLSGENAGNITLADTLGVGDTNSGESSLIADMISVLKNNLQEANLILLCFEEGRWHPGMFKMLEALESLFERYQLWNHVMIEITKWSYDIKAITDRERQGLTEEDTLLAINNQLKKNFHLNRSLPGVFLDSFAAYYPDDEVQTRFFRKFSSELWEAAVSTRPLSFNAVEQVQAGRTSVCGVDIECCEFLTNEINVIKERLTDHMLKIEENMAEIQSVEILSDINANNIDTNSEKIDTNTNNIHTNKNNIDTNTNNIHTNKNNIDTNTNNINLNKNSLYSITHNVNTNKNDIEINANNIDTNTHSIATNKKDINDIKSRQMSYCGYAWETPASSSAHTLTYSMLFTKVTSFGKGGLDPKTGIFTAPIKGTYLINAHFWTIVEGTFQIRMIKNDKTIEWGGIESNSNSDEVDDTNSRTLILSLEENDTLSLLIYILTARVHHTSFCITLLH